MIGVDIVKIERIAAASKKENFLNGVFTEKEIKRYKDTGCKPETLAGFFAAKEAVSKALGTGFRGFAPKDIEVYNELSGAPKVNLFNGAKTALADKEVSISISHDGEYAVAAAIIAPSSKP